MTDQIKPLWQLMFQAYARAPDTDEEGYAAEIEALRDWLVPEEPEPTYPPGGDWTLTQSYISWQERQRIRALLTEDARIAREGE